jgi:hypothetical protein
MIPEVFDDKDGILIQFDFENGLALAMKLDDDSAQDLIDIIQNKINARYKNR